MSGHWIQQRQGQGVVVFVHGVLSSCADCFANKNGTYWPQMIAAEPEFGNVGVYTYDYYSPKGPADYSILDIEPDLRLLLKSDGLLNNPWIVFVAHSMGGLLVRHFVLSNGEQLREGQTRVGLFLISSPSLGSTYANAIASVTKGLQSPQRDALQRVNNGDWLNNLNQQIDRARDRHPTWLRGREVVETKPISILGIPLPANIVDRASATYNFADPLPIANADHFSVAKPFGPRAPQHLALREFLLDHFVTKQGEETENGLVLDIDRVRQSQPSSAVAEIRFTLTNLTDRPIKIADIELEVARVEPLQKTMRTITAKPVDHYFLAAQIDCHTKSVNVLSASHLLQSGETDGFFLKVTAEDGYSYAVRLVALWKHFTEKGCRATSEELILNYPAWTPDALLRVLD